MDHLQKISKRHSPRCGSRLVAGFTLIELMIVVAVIGVMGAVLVPEFIRYGKNSKTEEVKEVLQAIGDGTLRFAAAENRLPTDLGELAQHGFIDEALGNGEKEGYDWVAVFDPAGSNDFRIEGYPASPYVGNLNFFMDQTGVVRYSENGPTDSSGPIAATLTLDPNTIHPAGTPTCWTGPYVPTSPPRTPVPTTLQAQFEADTQLHEISVTLLEGVKLDYPGPFAQAASAMVAVFGHHDPSGLAETLHFRIGQAVDNMSDGGPDGAFHLEDLLTPPQGDFDAQWVIEDIEESFGGCEGFCLALGSSSTDCTATCAEGIGTVEEPQQWLHSYVLTLIDALDLGIACQRKPPSIAFPAIEDEPRAFFLGAVSKLLTPEVPVLAPVVLGCAGLILAGVGIWRIHK